VEEAEEAEAEEEIASKSMAATVMLRTDSDQKSKLKTLCLARDNTQDTRSTAQLLTQTASLEKQASQTKHESEGGNENAKESNPIEVAEHSVAQGIESKQACLCMEGGLHSQEKRSHHLSGEATCGQEDSQVWDIMHPEHHP
jgi:hypothetical protein